MNDALARALPPEPGAPPLPFTVAFDSRDEAEVLDRWQRVLRSNSWSHGEQVADLEREWATLHAQRAVAFDNWTGAASAALDFVDVRDAVVLCPSNTFLATPRSATKAGARVVFYDCNREDLCGSYADFFAKAEEHRPKLAWIVHIGGHLAFDVERIAAYCREKGIWLFEDCAHAHGAEWNGRRGGDWGTVGIYSLYATKTISCGEGAIAVTRNPDLEAHLRSFRDYGRGSRYRIQGLNHRMDEFRAALAVVQTRRLPDIVAWKRQYAARVLDPHHPNRIRFPPGLRSGFYKYVVFDPIPKTTGRVYEEPCHRIFGSGESLPNTDWVAANHWCVPLYYPRDDVERERALGHNLCV